MIKHMNNDETVNLLVVDDKEENLHTMGRLLRGLPVEVDYAQSGKEALSLLGWLN